jgi:hypothetical protein
LPLMRVSGGKESQKAKVKIEVSLRDFLYKSPQGTFLLPFAFCLLPFAFCLLPFAF